MYDPMNVMRTAALAAQIEKHLDVLAGLVEAGPETLKRACAGREQIGQGRVGDVVHHVTRVYEQVARFAVTGGGAPSGRLAQEHDHRHQEPADLAAARVTVAQLAKLTDDQLAAVPAAGSMRFCDGQRDLGEVLAGVIRHQQHHIDALLAAHGS